MDSDGSNVRRLTRSLGGQIGNWSPVQSPDGTRIIFLSDHLGVTQDFRENIDLFVMDADGENERRVTLNTWMDAHPDWCQPLGAAELPCFQSAVCGPL